MRICNINTTVI